jgi:hypothetical protein
LREISEAVNIVVASAGRNLADFLVFRQTEVTPSAASVFHYGEIAIEDLKNISGRITSPCAYGPYGKPSILEDGHGEPHLPLAAGHRPETPHPPGNLLLPG